MTYKALPSQGRLQELLDYNPTTGIFTWKRNRTGAKKGDIAGWLEATGYRRIKIDGQRYYASRLAWMYVYNEDPGSFEIDHINHNVNDDSISNLRKATREQQLANRRSFSSSGFKGVTKRSKNRYQSHIYINGVNHYLGSFKTAEEASAAYDKVAIDQYNEFFYSN